MRRQHMKRKYYILATTILTMAMFFGGCAGAGGKGNTGGKSNESGQSSEKGGQKSEESQVTYEDDTLNFNVKDYVKLGEYKGLEVSYPVPSEVTKEDVDQYIQELLEENAEFQEDKDRKAQNGDTINIDFTGTINGEEFEGGSEKDYELELGVGEFLEEFEQNLLGKKAGETTTFTVEFPEDYDEVLGGQKVQFEVKINSVSEKIIPEYNVEFVKSVSEYETVKEYEESVKKELTESAESNSETEARENVMRLAVENAKVDGYPQALYDFFYDDMVSGYQAYAEMLGMEFEEFMEGFMGEEDIKEMVMEELNNYLVSRAILEQEGMTITEQEYPAAAKEMLEEYEYETLEDFEQDYGKTYILTLAVREKAADFLRDSAKLQGVPESEYYGDDIEFDDEGLDKQESGEEELDEEENDEEELDSEKSDEPEDSHRSNPMTIDDDTVLNGEEVELE